MEEEQPSKRLKLSSTSSQKDGCRKIKIIFKVSGKRIESLGNQARLNQAVFVSLLREKKLSLVLDLDHTLLHTTRFDSLTLEEQNLIINPTADSSFNGSLFRINIPGEDLVTKLRPGLQYFLREASKLFSLHVFTKGTSDYATEILKLIDPERIYFGSRARVFTRENCINNQKSLDLVTGKEGGILIVDDKVGVWRDEDKENVMVIPRYEFFGSSGKSRLADGTDESEEEGCLGTYLQLLKRIHETFFDPKGAGYLFDRDVRMLKRNLVEDLGNVCRNSLSKKHVKRLQKFIIAKAR